MIDTLMEIGIKKATIEKINENESLTYNLWCNIDDCKSIIEYLKSINIRNIDDILIYKPDMFMETKKDIENMFIKKNLFEIVNLINEDYMNIDIIFE